MLEKVEKYVFNTKWNDKLVSLKDELVSVFWEDQESIKKYYSQILNAINSNKKIKKEKIYQIVHIKLNDFIDIIKSLKDDK